MIIVTHDRYLLDAVAQCIWSLEEGEIKEYLGNYSYFKEKKAEENSELQIAREESKSRTTKRDLRKARVEIRKKTGKSSAYYEREIARLEIEHAEILTEMKKPDLATNWNALEELSTKEKEIRHKLDETLMLWENAAEAERNLQE